LNEKLPGGRKSARSARCPTSDLVEKTGELLSPVDVAPQPQRDELPHERQEAAFFGQRLAPTVDVVADLALGRGEGEGKVVPLAVVESGDVGGNRDLEIPLPLREQPAHQDEALPACFEDEAVHASGALGGGLPRLVAQVEQHTSARLRFRGPEPELQRPVEVAEVAQLRDLVALSEERRAPSGASRRVATSHRPSADRQVKRVAEPALHETSRALSHGPWQGAGAGLETKVDLVWPRVGQRHVPIRELIEEPEGDRSLVGPGGNVDLGAARVSTWRGAE
jgi:hypothetical protein